MNETRTKKSQSSYMTPSMVPCKKHKARVSNKNRTVKNSTLEYLKFDDDEDTETIS